MKPHNKVVINEHTLPQLHKRCIRERFNREPTFPTPFSPPRSDTERLNRGLSYARVCIVPREPFTEFAHGSGSHFLSLWKHCGLGV